MRAASRLATPSHCDSGFALSKSAGLARLVGVTTRPWIRGWTALALAACCSSGCGDGPASCPDGGEAGVDAAGDGGSNPLTVPEAADAGSVRAGCEDVCWFHDGDRLLVSAGIGAAARIEAR